MNEKKHDDFFDEGKEKQSPQQDLMDLIEKQDRKSTAKTFSKGDKVSGPVIKLGSEYAFLDIGAKNDAVMKVDELKDESGEVPVKEGDTIEGYIISDSEGEIVVSRSLAGYSGSIADLRNAMNSRMPVQGKVTGVNKGGLNVKIMGKRAFCPVSRIDVKYVEDVNSYLGKTMSFVITQITEGGRNIVVSRIPLLEQDLEKALDKLAADAGTGTVYTGTITRITKFGLFVDLGPAEGLVHISEVSWDRAEKLEESFVPGQKIECVILGVEKKKRLQDTKISLSIKQVQENPWEQVAKTYSVGSQVHGEVTRLTDFGAFVKLTPGIEGLVHVSEMAWGKRVRHPKDVLSEGQQVKVTVLRIDENKREISLTLKDVDSDPWKNITVQFPVGSIAKGTVASRTKYGYFIDLTEEITGLLPNSNIGANKKGSIKVGDEIEVRIQSIDLERRRISLSYGIEHTEENAQEMEKFMKEQKKRPAASSKSSSEFGEALRAALTKKK
ncbi:MAG: S1 RNA-binding domain-containing protein [Chitinivibrionales bacterium]|nr:S1 RNA-binding domain-containing protein [Chitinivibrionales bacterium]